jgi:molybdate transport system permease protein
MLSDTSLSAISLSLQLACLTVFFLLLLGTPLAYWLAKSQWRYKALVEAVIALPLVLPPTVIGFYLLLFLGPHGPLTDIMDFFGVKTLNFTFSGLLIGSIFYSLPFVVQPLQQAFLNVQQQYLEAAVILGSNKFECFYMVVLPLAKPGYLTACVLGFAHTLGEFGVVLMIGGNIPGKTQVLSINIYEQVEMLQYTQAHWLSAGLLIFSFILLLTIYLFNGRFHGAIK